MAREKMLLGEFVCGCVTATQVAYDLCLVVNSYGKGRPGEGAIRVMCPRRHAGVWGK